MKTCPKCNTPKLLDEFPKDKAKASGRRGICKQCKNKQDTTREDAIKIYCARGEGGMINKEQCLPGCNDVCSTCTDRQEGNLRAINSTTAEEEKAQIYNCGTGDGRGGGFTPRNKGTHYKGNNES